MTRPASVALFFTRGMSLAAWDAVGMLARELALYRRYLQAGRAVTLVSYGGPEEEAIASRELPGVTLCCNRDALDPERYAAGLAAIHARELSRADVFKTNQVMGSAEALAAARALGKPLVARCGYLLSDFARRMHGQGSPQHREALETEASVFAAARAVVTPTRDMARDVLARVPGARVAVVPNHVAGEHFPERSGEPDFDLCFAGRLAPQKNVLALLEALERTGRSCLLVGDGELRGEVARLAAALGPRVAWEPRVPHERLGALMGRARLFVLPSHYEGHPKTLLEAMFMGLPVLGADSPGIARIVRESGGGWLCGVGADDIAGSVERALSDAGELARRGALAMRHARERYCLDAVALTEAAVLDQAACDG